MSEARSAIVLAVGHASDEPHSTGVKPMGEVCAVLQGGVLISFFLFFSGALPSDADRPLLEVNKLQKLTRLDFGVGPGKMFCIMVSLQLHGSAHSMYA